MILRKMPRKNTFDFFIGKDTAKMTQFSIDELSRKLFLSDFEKSQKN